MSTNYRRMGATSLTGRYTQSYRRGGIQCIQCFDSLEPIWRFDGIRSAAVESNERTGAGRPDYVFGFPIPFGSFEPGRRFDGVQSTVVESSGERVRGRGTMRLNFLYPIH